MNIKKMIAVTVVCSAPCALHASEYLVEQKDKAFSKSEINVKVGDTIEFKNADPFNHNIFSLSDVKLFDLGSYPKGESRKVTFDQPGDVDVECAIHPSMMLKVKVSK